MSMRLRLRIPTIECGVLCPSKSIDFPQPAPRRRVPGSDTHRLRRQQQQMANSLVNKGTG